MALIGYARVSTKRQNPQHQVDALKAAGCERVFIDKVSGKLSDNPELRRALDYARPGDVLVVTRLARLANSTKHLIELAAKLEADGYGFKSLREPQIDTTTAVGRGMFGLFAVLAELNREYISEQTRDGLDAARARGRRGGRNLKMTPGKVAIAQEMYESKKYTVAQIGLAISVSPRTIYRHLEPHKEKPDG